MNLALITQDFPPQIGGIETYSAELARRFSSRCENFFLMAPDKPCARKNDQVLPYSVHRIATKNPLLGLKAMPKAPLLFKQYSVENVFNVQWQTLPLSIFARKQGIIKTIFAAAHGKELLFNPFYHYPLAKQAYEKYKRWMLSQVDFFFPVSAYMANLLRLHGVKDDRIKIVNNGTDPAKFYPLDKQAARQSIKINAKNILLSAARLVSKKGIDTTLKAFKKVLQNHPNSCYVIAGEGNQEEYLKQLAAQLGITDSTKFIGPVPHNELINYYNACDVFVMPSKTELPDVEGFGIVFLEANACKKPVIGTFSGGIPSAVVNGETGILVEERNPRALAEAIDTLLSNEELATAMGEKGRKRVENEANWDVTAAKLLRYMENKI